MGGKGTAEPMSIERRTLHGPVGWAMIRATMDERFGPEHRLQHRMEFERVYRHGLMAKSRSLRVFALPRRADGDGAAQDEDGTTPRLGLSVGTKVGSAVVRNRLKRRIREWFRTHKRAVWGWDVIVQAKPPASALDYGALSGQLDDLTQDLHAKFEERSDPHEP